MRDFYACAVGDHYSCAWYLSVIHAECNDVIGESFGKSCRAEWLGCHIASIIEINDEYIRSTSPTKFDMLPAGIGIGCNLLPGNTCWTNFQKKS